MVKDATASEIVVRRVRADDWKAIKAIRLEMLLDSPLAFVTTYEEAAAHDDRVWIDRCSHDPDGEIGSFAAFTGRDAVGMAVGVDKAASGWPVVSIVSVYVSPSLRRHGVAGRLMGSVELWAAARGATSTSLWVVDGNEGARAFYDRRGYESTGDRQRITTPPIRWETRLEKRLSP